MSLLEIENVDFYYGPKSPDSWSLHIPELRIAPGQMLLLSGDNMSGKTTLLNLIGGLFQLPDNGSIVLDGATAKQTHLADASILLSADDNMFPELTVAENVLLALPELSFSERPILERQVQSLFDRSQILKISDIGRRVGDLSSGGRAMVKLARASSSRRPLIVVDEISSFLDAQRAEFFLNTLLEFCADKRSVVIVSHNQRDRELMLQRAAEVVAYHIHRDGQRSELRRRPHD